MALKRAKDLRRRGVCGAPKADAAAKPRHATGIQWPSFVGTATKVGTSGQVTVYVDASLGAQANQNASDLLAAAGNITTFNNDLFGTPGGPVNVIVFALGGSTDGTGGADHMGCDYTTGNDIEVDASYGQSIRVQALFEAELSECSMGAVGNNLCGSSTGEALSRWCAAWMTNNALADFVTATYWVQDGMANWVDQVEPTDQDADSIGCGMVFLSWLMSLGHPLKTIAPAMVALGDSGTLAALYEKLTTKNTAWADFQAAVAALPGGAAGITTDDPFGALASAPAPLPVPQPQPQPAPQPVPQPQPQPQPAPKPAPQPAPQPAPAPAPTPDSVPTASLQAIISFYRRDPHEFPRYLWQDFAAVEAWLNSLG